MLVLVTMQGCHKVSFLDQVAPAKRKGGCGAVVKSLLPLKEHTEMNRTCIIGSLPVGVA